MRVFLSTWIIPTKYCVSPCFTTMNSSKKRYAEKDTLKMLIFAV